MDIAATEAKDEIRQAAREFRAAFGPDNWCRCDGEGADPETFAIAPPFRNPILSAVAQPAHGRPRTS